MSHFCKPNVWLIKRQLESCICFCIKSVALCSYGWTIWRKFSLTAICSWKSERYFCSLFRWILPQTSTSDSFIKVSYNEEWETLISELLYCYINICQYVWLFKCLLPRYVCWTSYVTSWQLLRRCYTYLPNVDTFHYLISKIVFVHIHNHT